MGAEPADGFAPDSLRDKAAVDITALAGTPRYKADEPIHTPV